MQAEAKRGKNYEKLVVLSRFRLRPARELRDLNMDISNLHSDILLF